MVAEAILKIRKITIYPQRKDQFWRYFERWCVSALWTLDSQ